MGLNRTATRRDGNERPIILALEAVGASVLQISKTGAPDLDVGYKGKTYHFEIKVPGATLTPDQIKYHEQWKGSPIYVVTSVPEALTIIGAVEYVSELDNKPKRKKEKDE